jgi:Zn-dependent M28 family amino/carboxypeptidase
MKSALALALLATTTLFAADAPDLQIQTRIRQEGFRNSKVMEIASGLTDTVGARLTGSPNMKRANDWTVRKLADFGLSNAHLEPWGPFGRGWSYESFSVRMTTPDVEQLVAYPRAWSPGTNGVVRGTPVKVKIDAVEDLEKLKGKLAGKIVMIGEADAPKLHEKSEFSRLDEKALANIEQYEVPAARAASDFSKRIALRRAINKFLADENVAVAIIPGTRGDAGTFNVQQSGSQKLDEPLGVPSLVLSTEHYGRIARLLDRKEPVELEIDVKANIVNENQMAANTIAELPGRDKDAGVVMLGAHLDSWHSGTGATDNAAGCAAMMEAMRILKSLGVTPRRTIRIALWSGEEQGLLGSSAYVSEHFGARPESTDPAEKDLPRSMRKKLPLAIKPEHAKLSAYFNMDNGTGKIRGIYAQENAAARPIFEAWLAPLHDLGATTVTMRNTGSTDHISFDDVGLPGFQFIQDDIEYETLTHHTNYDTYERLQREDLMQAAVVIATFAWEAANRPEMMPRKPLPTP